MKSPKDMRIIQIDITNACVHECSNCTRFCGHHKKPYFMGWEMFKKSVDSLTDFEKCIGIMGGEPTIHPEFERFAKYIAKKYPSTHNIESARKPIKEFARYIHDKNYILDECLNQRKGPGLWTSVCNQYYKYFELIQDTFSFQNINDHQNPSLHQPLLVSRKEMGINDEEWIPLRDNCWIQNEWSATITPKGAFFCEVAGALDMLFDGPGGWKVEPGWWRREPSEFGEQLRWCEICGGALFHSGRLSSEEIDDVSAELYKKLKSVGSPKLKRKNRVVIMDTKNSQKGTIMPETINRYLVEHEKRVSLYNKTIFPKSIDGLIVYTDEQELEKNAKNLEVLEKTFDKLITLKNSDSDIFGRLINKAIKKSNKDWICFWDLGHDLSQKYIERLKSVVLNPGVLYKIDYDKGIYMFNVNSYAIKMAGFDQIAYCEGKDDFTKLWNNNKVVSLDNTFDLVKNPDLDYWYTYVKDINIKDKENLYKCLRKIKSDY
ncbi:hypothetical protein [Vallitalea guaymasensis]|uniref:hypothetical protein n=1 Tax=Vallitalea guaymasensis TaxID=1185412 RepID=UPI000DE2C347|nr:hypothetical protein [Vallitalea guaymasensis]